MIESFSGWYTRSLGPWSDLAFLSITFGCPDLNDLGYPHNFWHKRSARNGRAAEHALTQILESVSNTGPISIDDSTSVSLGQQALGCCSGFARRVLVGISGVDIGHIF